MPRDLVVDHPVSISRRRLGLAALTAPVVVLAAEGQAQAALQRQAAVPGTAIFSAGTTHALGGLEPQQITNGWHFEVPASATPDNSRRSELWWNAYGTPASYHAGDVANYAADFCAAFGAAANSNFDWHVVWQLHGPTFGVWKGPAQTLTVANGKLRMTGGSGHPDHDPASGRYYQWFKDLVPFRNGAIYKVRIQTLLSTEPDEGWITAWVNSKKLLDRWRPQSHTGLRPGTISPGQSQLNNRSGLYRGTLPGGKAPTYRQWATHVRPQVF